MAWLGLPRSLSSIRLNGNSKKLGLPFSSVRELFIVKWAHEHLHYIGSGHQSVQCSDHCEDGEDVEGSHEAQGPSWECGTGQERTQELKSDLVGHCTAIRKERQNLV